MPQIVKPAGWELMAQNLAKGMKIIDAFVAAGYAADNGNATNLAKRPEVAARLAELLAEREHIHAAALARAVEETGMDKAWVLLRLRENVDRAMQAKPHSIGGVPTGEYRWDAGAANRGLELIGKELGMFVDRSEQTHTQKVIRREPMTEQEWLAEHGMRQAANETKH